MTGELIAGHGPLVAGWWACQQFGAEPSPDARCPTWYRTTCEPCMLALRSWIKQGGRWVCGMRFAGGRFNGRSELGIGFVAAPVLLDPELRAGPPIDAVATPWVDEPPERLVVARQRLSVGREDGLPEGLPTLAFPEIIPLRP